MALLTLDERKAIFEELGLEYNEATIKALQSKYMLRKKDADGIYGTNTDNMLRTVWNTLRLTKNFKPEEFRCDCGGRHCCGFPSYMKANELKHIQAIRDHWGRPITVTQGLRCKGRNKELRGSAVNSGHMYGRAIDFYQKGVTDTLANRKVSIKWIKKQFAHKYSYGNGIDSSGYKYNAPYMGNCLHTETTGDNMAPIPKWKEEEVKPTKPVYKVIDVSDWQDKIDWNKVKADGVVGAIIRYADGTTLDKRFTENMANAKAVGMHVGSYIFSRAKTKAQAEAEAERIFAACKIYDLDMPIYIDLEVAKLSKYADTVAPAFLNKMKALGGRGGVYAYLNWWNNYLKNTAKNYSASPFWIAQYNSTMTYKPASKMGMWQYSSDGSVNGIKGRVDMNQCYVQYWPDEPVKVPYSGELPSTKIVKTNAEVKEDTTRFASWIAGDNRFHYGYTNKHGSSDRAKWNPNAHHNGCYFCGTNVTTGGCSKAGITDYERTYCCNPFVGAAFAHGGCVPKALELCRKQDSWDYHKGKGYDKSSLFDKLGKPAKDKLQKCDVLCSESHVALYMGGGKIAHASGGDDNVRNSERWNKSIRVETLTDAMYKNFDRVYRYNGSVDTTAPIRHGEISKRVELMQKFLIWYGLLPNGSDDGIFGDGTLEAVKNFQTDMKISVDGVVGNDTIGKMQEVKK